MPMLNKTRPLYRHLKDDWYRLYDKLRYMDNETAVIYEVAEGTEWDLGTVMAFIPRMIVPHGDRMTYPSLLHDKFYRDYSVTKRVADRIFRQFLIEEGMPKWRAWTAWAVVRGNINAQIRWGKA